MSTSYRAVIGVGVDEEDITYQSLTEVGKMIVGDIYYNDFGGESEDSEDIADWFADNIHEYELFYELGLDAYTGNLFHGWHGKRGVGLRLDISGMQDNLDKAIEEFKKVVDLEPILFHGVLVS